MLLSICSLLRHNCAFSEGEGYYKQNKTSKAPQYNEKLCFTEDIIYLIWRFIIHVK